jgi:hypothetical protein
MDPWGDADVSSEDTDDVAATGRAPAASAERERTVARALDSLTAQLNQFTSALELRESAASAMAAAVNEIRAATSSLTEPLHAALERLGELDLSLTELAERLQAALDAGNDGRSGGVTPDDLQPLVAAVAALGERDHEALTREVAAISRSVATWRVATAQDHEALVSSVAHLLARPEVDVAALAEAIEELRSRPAPDTAPLGDLTTAMAELTGELDAVGRVLQDAIASLHRIEDGTVGSNPRRDRSRQSAIAAVDDLRAAHQRRTGADRGDTDHEANDPGATA